MPESSILAFLLALAVLLGGARLLGELARVCGLPLIAGELLAGMLLGKTILGRIAPAGFNWIFGGHEQSIMLTGYTSLAVVLLLVVAGLEVDIGIVIRKSKTAIAVSLLGIVLPFAGGTGLGMLLPAHHLLHPENRLLLALFLGTALSISALPVIAKTLLDLGLFKTELGLLVMSAATVNDLIGWLGFSILVGPMRGGTADGVPIIRTVVSTLLFVGLMLTIGRKLIDAAVSRLERERAAAERVLSLVILLALLGAAVTNAIGLHAVFGGFIVGVSVGNSPALKERTRVIMREFVTNIFAPVFFASLGLGVDFVASFDWRLCFIVFGVASVAKIVGCSAGARFGGLKWRESLAVGFGLNSRGAMEIILALLAHEAGLIGEPVLVALVFMALATSLSSGPLMKLLLYSAQEEGVVALLRRGAFVKTLAATTPTAAIEELTLALSHSLGSLGEAAKVAVIDRERLAPTALGDEVALPHAAVQGLTEPILALGLSSGIEFDAPDGRPVRIVFLLLMPPREYEAEVRILASIARSIFDERARKGILGADHFETALRVLGENAKRTEEARRGPPAPSLADI